MILSEQIDTYAAGPDSLRRSIEGMSEEQLDATPIPGKWSTRQVVCHIADFELVYADRMKRVIAENEPTFFGGDPDTFAAGLAYAQRDVNEELQLIDSIRRQMTRILRTLSDHDFDRIGNHSEAGPMTLATLLQGITGHLTHHIHFVDEKRRVMQSPR